MKTMTDDTNPRPAAWRTETMGGGGRKVLVIVHQRRSNPGYVGRWLRGHGYALDMRRPRFGDPLPESLDDYAGVVVFGGPMSANDEHDYIHAELDLIERTLKAEKPFLGICLGAQMLARQLGGRVFFHARGQVEIGYHPIRPLHPGRRFPHWPSHVYQWHREGFEAPRDAIRLAEGPVFEHQAFQYGSGVRPAVPPGDHPADDRPLDNALAPPAAPARRKAAPRAHRRAPDSRAAPAPVAQPFSRGVDKKTR